MPQGFFGYLIFAIIAQIFCRKPANFTDVVIFKLAFREFRAWIGVVESQ